MIRTLNLLLGAATLVLLTSCGDQFSPLPPNTPSRGIALVSHGTFWTAYNADATLRAIVDENLAYDGFGAWGRGEGGTVDLSFRVSGTELTHHHSAATAATTVDIAPLVPTSIRKWTGCRNADQSDLTIVTGYDDSSGESRLIFFWNGTAGASLDPASRMDVVTRADGRFTGTAIDRERRRIYVVDVRNFEVLRVDDSNADGVPDALAPAPAVAYPTFSGDTTTGELCIGIEFLERGGMTGLLPLGTAQPSLITESDEQYRGAVFWEDSDADGDVDSVTTWAPAGFDRLDLRDLYAGNQLVRMDAEPGANREIWKLDTLGGTPSEKLFDVPNVGTRPLSASLTRMLASGEHVGVTTDAGQTVLWSATVEPSPYPDVFDLDPIRLPLGQSGTIVVTGERFRTGVSAKLTLAGQLVATGSVSFISSTEVHVQFPAITDVTIQDAPLELVLQNPLSNVTRTAPYYISAP